MKLLITVIVSSVILTAILGCGEAGHAKITIDGTSVEGPPFIMKITGKKSVAGTPLRAQYEIAGDVRVSRSLWPASPDDRKGLRLNDDTLTINYTSHSGKYLDHQDIRARITDDGHSIAFKGRLAPLSTPEKCNMTITVVDYSKQIDAKYKTRKIFEHPVEFVR